MEDEKLAYSQFSMAIVKASIPDKTNRTMRISMVNSDTGEDVYEERMSVELFSDFVKRISENSPVPEPFDVVVNEDGWQGGMPYPSISHYRSGAGSNVPGEIEKVYVDGEKLKSTAILHDTSLGVAVWKSICRDIEEKDKPLEEKTYANPVRISIGFLDLEHKHELEDGDDYVFTRTELAQKCEKCEAGINGKVYTKGQLVHLAFTRVPANPRTSVEVFRMSDKINTKKEDAESIIGDLAEELVGKSAVEDDVLVVKASQEEKDLEQYAYSVRTSFYDKFDPPKPMMWVRSVTEKNVVVSEDGKLYRVGYSEKDGEFNFDKRSDWEEVMIGLIPVKSEAEESEWKIEFEQEKSNASEEVMEKDNQVINEPVQEAVVEEPVVDAAPTKSKAEIATENLMAKFAELKAKNITGESAVKAIQPFFNEVGNVVKSELSNPMDTVAETMRSVLREELAALRPELVAEVLKAMPAAVTQPKSEVPVARSLIIDRNATQGRELSQIEKLALNSTVGVAPAQ